MAERAKSFVLTRHRAERARRLEEPAKTEEFAAGVRMLFGREGDDVARAPSLGSVAF